MSPPADAIRISLWLVQGQHLTATQANRLLSAAAERTQIPEPLPPAFRSHQPKSPPSPSPAKAPEEELELAPEDERGNKHAATEPAKPDSPATGRGKVGAKSEARGPSGPLPEGKKDKKTAAAAKIGGELESLEKTMKGPLDALIESETLASTGFEDPLAGSQFDPARPRKFKLRRFLKKLFRRDKSKVVRIKATDPRQVKLVLISWGVGVSVILGLLILAWWLSPPPPSEFMQKAEDAELVKDYGQAIVLYDKFLKHYPKEANADNVRYLRGLAKLRQAEQKAAAEGDWTPAVEAALTELKELPGERGDPEIVLKLAVALANIGQGAARQAQGHPDEESVSRLQAVVNILENDIPERIRPAKMLEEIKARLGPDRQEVEGRRELERTTTEIAAAADSDRQAAYKAYREFVKSYPERSDDARLADAMKLVSAAERKTIKPVQKLLAAAHDERPSDLVAAMPLAVQPVKGELAEGQGKRVFAVAQGTVFGLDAANGKTLWRRFVALDPKPTTSTWCPAVTASPLAGPAGHHALVVDGVVLCDRVRQELLRLEGSTGALVWRLAVGAPIVGEPVPAGTWLLLLTKDHRLLVIDATTGDCPRYFELPQAVRLPPVFDAAHGLIFLVAEASNLIVLGGEPGTGQCRQVLHIGHEPGTIAAPPTVVGNFLLLAVNDTPGKATLRVLAISDKEGDPLSPAQTIPLEGRVNTAPVAWGGGAAIVTAQGGLLAIERNEAAGRPFQVVASRPGSSMETSVRCAVSAGDKFWVADRQLTRYAVHADERRIVPEVIPALGMALVQPPVIDGGTMFQVLQRPGMPGLTVSAFDLRANEAVWQTWVAAPLAAEPVLGPVSGKLTAVTASGGVFRGPPDGLKSSDKPWDPTLAVESSRLRKPLCSLLPVRGDMFAMTSGADTTQIVIYDPKEQDRQFRWLLSPREMSVPPGLFAGGLLTACVNGQVFLLDADARGNIAKPLEPAVKDVTTWEWQPPVAVDNQLAVLCDGDKRLTLVRVSGDEEKALAEAAAITTESKLVSPVAVLGKLIFVAARGAAATTDSLLSFALPDLARGGSQVLDGRCAWGPQRVGKWVLVGTDKDRLLAIDERGQVAWRSALGYGPLAGAPQLAGDEIFLAARSGVVWRISAAGGKELGKVDAGCPLGTGPLVVGSQVLVGGHEGSLLVVKRP